MAYNTKQKQYIDNCLKNCIDKPMTCDEISEILKREGTPVGKATLYRHLETLVKKGEVRKISEDNSGAEFQLVNKALDCDNHMHLKCNVCGSIEHLGCEFMKSTGEHILVHHGFSIDNSRSIIYGVCYNCRNKVK